MSDLETGIMGTHTMHNDSEIVNTFTEQIRETRDLIKFWAADELVITNTMFR